MCHPNFCKSSTIQESALGEGIEIWVCDAKLSVEDTQEILGPIKYQDPGSTDGTRNKVHLAEVLLAQVRHGSLKGRPGTRYHILANMFEVIGAAIESTRLDPVWKEMPVRHLPELTSKTGRAVSHTIEYKLEVARTANALPGMTPTRLVEAAAAWGRGAPTATSSNAAAADAPVPAQDTEEPVLDVTAALTANADFSAQSTRQLQVGATPRWRCKTEFNWAIAGQLNLSGRQAASWGPQPGSFGWITDGVTIDGESINPGIAFLPNIKKVLWMPVFAPGLC